MASQEMLQSLNSLRGLKVLIVESNPQERHRLVETFQRQGANVTALAQASEVAALSDSTFDLTISRTGLTPYSN